MRWVNTIRQHLPRRKRQWRYVSARRQGAGLLVWMALIAMIYGYWHLTNNERVCRQATAYLCKITGAQVTIRSAEFNLFGPIELSGVRVFTLDPQGREAPQPLLKADTVVLHHRPWELLFQQRFSPSEIRVIEPEISIVHYADERGTGGIYNFQRLRVDAGRGPAPTAIVLPVDLPAISMVDCTLRRFKVSAGKTLEIDPSRWNISIAPRGSKELQITIEPSREPRQESLAALSRAGLTPEQIDGFLKLPRAQRPAAAKKLAAGSDEIQKHLLALNQADETLGGGVLTVAVDISTGTVRPLPGSGAWIPSLASALPEQYQALQRQFAVEGRVRVRPQSGPQAAASLEIELMGASLQIPNTTEKSTSAPAASSQDAPPVLKLRNVVGVLKFDPKGLTIHDVSGQIDEAQGARFTVSGRYDGYESTSPFRLDIAAQDVHVPQRLAGENELSNLVAMIQKWYSPSGPMDIIMHLERPAGGSIAVNGVLTPRNMSFHHLRFPYRTHKATGTIEFNNSTVILKQITCQRNGGRSVINGTANLLSHGREYDVTVASEEVPCDDDLRLALPPLWQKFWNQFSPQGLVATRVRVHRTLADEHDQVEVDISADGRLSMEYSGFPYRLDNLIGAIHADGGGVTIEHLRGRRGKMQCRIDGRIAGTGGDDPNIDVAVRTIEGYPLALDAALCRALSPKSSAMLRSLHLAGDLDNLVVRIQRDARQPLNYTISGKVSDASFKPEFFPYAISHASADVQIAENKMVLSNFHARHGETPIALAGEGIIYLTDSPGAQIDIVTGPLAMDMDLYTALPPTVVKIWDQFSVGGSAQMRLKLRHNTPENPAALDYELQIAPRQGRFLCRDFPLALSDVTGLISAVPGKIVLSNVSGRSGEGNANLNGTVTYDDLVTEADLSVQAQNVPLTAPVLEALPQGLGALAGRLRPGGTGSVNLSKLTLKLSPPPPAPSATTRPAAQRLTAWSADGVMSFHNAVIQMGLRDRHFSGGLSGSAGYSPAGLMLNTKMSVDRMLVGSREISDVHAHLLKKPADPHVTLEDFVGKAYGGRMAGEAKVSLADPSGYTVRLSVEDIRLEDLVRIENPGAAALSDVAGLLQGTIVVSGDWNNDATMQATGKVRITKAKILKLPVMLGLLQVITLNLPGESAFTEGYVGYRLSRKQLVFDEIHLSGPALTIVGSGTLNMATRALKLRFLSGPQRNLPRIEFLDGFFKGMMREVGEIDIDGTLDRPEIKTVPMRSLDTFIKQLLRPDQRED
ncbi:MAG: hypothetical protein ABFD92_04815 [Planctomycetaceae bacterium]|nr:hypothetical protein [Planctomycetaceae bacterium]